MKFNRLVLPVLAVSLSAPCFTLALPTAAPAAYAAQDNSWETAPSEFTEIQRQGYHDGVEAARKDFDHHRRSDVMNRKEYRHPKVAPSGRKDYREGFKRGYDAAAEHIHDQYTPGKH